MSIYHQVLDILARPYTPPEIPIVVRELTNIRCQEAQKVMFGVNDGRLVKLLQALIEALEKAERVYNKRSYMNFSRNAQEVKDCTNDLRSYCLKKIS